MKEFTIENAKVNVGYVTFIHAKIQDQSLETLKALGRGKQSCVSSALIYGIDFTHRVVLWN